MGLSTGLALGGQAISGVLGNNAEKKARAAQQQAAAQAMETQRQMQEQARTDLQPWRQTGVSATERLSALSGLNGQPVDYSMFTESPDYQFALEEGQKAANQSLAARGMAGGGTALKELTRFGQGLASQRLDNYKQQLMNLSGMGQNAVNTGINVGTNVAGNISNLQSGLGQANASSYMRQGQNLMDTVGGLTNTGVLSNMGAFDKLKYLQPQTAAETSSAMGASTGGYSPEYMNAFSANQKGIKW